MPPDQDIAELIRQCSMEPIQFPGSIQPHGATIIASNTPDLTVIATSENIGDFTGTQPTAVLSRALLELFDTESVSLLKKRISGRDKQPVLPVALTLRDGSTLQCCSVLKDASAILLEVYSPPNSPVDAAVNVSSFPLEAYISLLDDLNALCEQNASLATYLDKCVTLQRQVTAFDRVMAYRFLPDGSGEVVAEGRRDDIEPFLGLRYPASDIPPQARMLYKRNTLRQIPDVNYRPVALVANPDIAPDAIDLSASTLRSVSPVHVEYLTNMGVRATLTSSIMVDGELWGLFAFHHYAPKYCNVATLQMVASLTRQASNQIRLLNENESIRQLADTRRSLQVALEDTPVTSDLLALFQSLAPTLAACFTADGLSISIENELVEFGVTPSHDVTKDVVAAFESNPEFTPLYSADFLPQSEITDCDLSPLVGLLALKLSNGVHLLFWRKAVVESVRWAGKPEKAVTIDRNGSQRLRPRGSFAEWVEEHGSRCKAWSEHDHLLAHEFRASFAALVLRQNASLAALNNELSVRRDEMANFIYSVSHDLKSPVVTLKSFISVLKDDLRDGNNEDIADSLSRIDRSASRLSTIIDEMLELSKLGYVTGDAELLPLTDVVNGIVDDLRSQGHLDSVTVTVPPHLPAANIYRSPMERAIENLITNAIKYACRKGTGTVEITAEQEGKLTRLHVYDRGPGVPERFRQKIFDLFERYDTSIEGTGIGLALVAKVAKIHNGRAYMNPRAGGGADFVMEWNMENMQSPQQ